MLNKKRCILLSVSLKGLIIQFISGVSDNDTSSMACIGGRK